jgi:hypothetical protein
MRKGPVKFPEYEPGGRNDAPTSEAPAMVDLPAAPIIDVGIREFNRLAKTFWADANGTTFKLTQFDSKNVRQLRFTLGLVYMAMREADK